MSEFKFACPVCGQHITSGSSASGTQIECPTCFQKLVVPQPPATGQKLILTATLAGAKRTTQAEAVAEAAAKPRLKNRAIPISTLVFFLLVVATAGFVAYKSKSLRILHDSAAGAGQTNPPAPPPPPPPPAVFDSPYPVPTNSAWTLNLTNALILEGPVAGRIARAGFGLERATIERGALSLRQGKAWPSDLGITIIFFSQTPEELAGKSIEVTPDRSPPLPRVIRRWKTADGEAHSREFEQGYALKAMFDKPKDGFLPGRIYLALPDEEQSYISGTFTAEIRKPQARKTRPPRPPTTNTPALRTNAPPTNAPVSRTN